MKQRLVISILNPTLISLINKIVDHFSIEKKLMETEVDGDKLRKMKGYDFLVNKLRYIFAERVCTM